MAPADELRALREDMREMLRLVREIRDGDAGRRKEICDRVEEIVQNAVVVLKPHPAAQPALSFEYILPKILAALGVAFVIGVIIALGAPDQAAKLLPVLKP